jgi:hypothetical protein
MFRVNDANDSFYSFTIERDGLLCSRMKMHALYSVVGEEEGKRAAFRTM